MKQAKDIFYGLDIQKDYITVVQYSAESNAVTLVALQPISSGNTADKELGTLKNKFKFTDSHVNCSLPAQYAVVKRVPVDRDEHDINAALSWELEQNIIGNPDDYVFDYMPYGRRSDNIEEYQIVAYRKDRVEGLAALLKNHRLVSRFVDLDIFALVNVFEASYPDFTDRPAIIIHAETADTRLILTHHGKLVDYEPLKYDPEPDPQTFCELVHAGIGRLCTSAVPEVPAQEIAVFASGLLFAQDGFLQQVAAVLPGLTLLHPFRKIQCRIGVDEDKLSNYLSQLSVAVGLAIRGDE